MPIINTTPAVVGSIIKQISGTQGSDQVVKDIQIQGHKLIFTYGDSGRINIINVDGTPLPIDQTDKSVSIDLSGKADVGHTHGNITSDGKLGTANRVVVTDGNKVITTTTNVTDTELGYIDGVTSNIQTQIDGKIKRGSYERIEGTSTTHKNLNSYITAGFYNVKGVYVDNCPVSGEHDWYLMVMPWNTGNWCAQICVMGNYETTNDNKMWIRSTKGANASQWTSWKQVASTSDIPTTYVSSVNGNSGAVTGIATTTQLTDGSVTKVGTGTVGGALKPMYLDAGVPTDGTQLYSKNININGTNREVIRSTNADIGTIYAPTTAGSSGQVVKSNGSGAPSWLTLGAAASKAVETTLANDDKLPTGAAVKTYVDNAINALPEPMVFQGTLGKSSSSPTVHYLTHPVLNEGKVYKCIDEGTLTWSTTGGTNTTWSDGTGSGTGTGSGSGSGSGEPSITYTAGEVTFKVGDVLVSNGSDWVLVPSGDEPSGTVMSVSAGTGLETNVSGGGPIVESGTLSVKYGTTAGTACEGNDFRLSNARTPTAHTHAISDVTNLQTTLDGKAASGHNHDGRYWQVLGDLGSSYTMAYSDFNQAYPCRRKVNTFATNGESPDGANVGDYYLYSLGHTDNRGYSTIIAVTPRLNGTNAGTRMFIGHFWNGAWKGWTEVAPSNHTHNYAGSSEAGGAATTALACTGNAATATTLQTTRSINGTNFNGSANITTSKWGTARNITISDNDGTNTQATNSIDGSANFTLKLPATIKASLTGNASTATAFSANKSVALTGDVTGSASSTAGWSVATTLAASGVTAGSYGPSANASPAHGAGFSVPYVTVDTKGRVTAASTKTITLPAQYTHPDSGVTAGTYRSVTVNAQGHVTAGTNPTTHTMTQVGGETKTYTTGANTTRVILARVNNYTGLASCRIKLEIGPDTSSGAKVAYLDAVWAGRGARLVIESVYDWNNAVRYFFITCPNNTSYYTSYPPEIHIQQNTAVARTIKATIIERSGDVVLMDNLTTTGVATNRNSYTYDVNNTVGLYDNAGYINTSGWSNGTWDRVDNDRYRISATKVFVNGSTNRGVRGGKLSGMGSDGYLHHVATPEMTFQLPFMGGRTTGDFDINSTWGRVSYAIRGIGTAEFTNLLVCNTAALTAGSTYTGTGTCYATQYRFNVPGETEVTTLTAGKNVYVIGNLDSNGNFKPYYTTQAGQTIAVPKGQGGFTANTNCVMYKYTFYLTQTPVYNANYNTFLFIGRSDQSTTQFSYMTYNPIAYTLNSNNKLTHIDGKQIYDSGNSGGTVTTNGTMTDSHIVLSKGGTVIKDSGVTISSTVANNLTTVPNGSAVIEYVTGLGYTRNTGTVTQVKVGSTAYNPSSGVISLPAYPTVSYPVTSVNSKTGAVSLTASDVSALPSNTSFATINGTSVKSSTAFNVSTITKGTFTMPAANTRCKLIEITNADYVSNNYTAHLKFRIRTTINNVYENFTVEVHWSGTLAHIVAFTGNFANTTVAPLRYLSAYVTKTLTASGSGCFIMVENGSTTARNMSIEVLEADVPFTLSSGTLAAHGQTDTNFYIYTIDVAYLGTIAVVSSGAMRTNILGSSSTVNTTCLTTNAEYSLLGTNGTSSGSQTPCFEYASGRHITFNPSTKTITATGGFIGDVTGNVTGNCSGSAGRVAWANVTGKPTTTNVGNVATGTFTHQDQVNIVTTTTTPAARQQMSLDTNCVPSYDAMTGYADNVLERAYPVGSIYMNASSNTNPATLLGFGTWTQLAPGRVLMGAGDSSYPAGSEGGEATHQLTISEMPAHDHSITIYDTSIRASVNIRGGYFKDYDGSRFYSNGSRSCQDNTGNGNWGEGLYLNADHGHGATIYNKGGDGSHNNLQPYLVVYMWQRTE